MNACLDLDGLAHGIATSIDARFAFDGDLLGCCRCAVCNVRMRCLMLVCDHDEGRQGAEELPEEVF